jgi:ubiquinone/menaquinone biosynthesis C-methylase UbiE
MIRQGIISKSVTFGDEIYDQSYLRRAHVNFDSPERTRQQTDFLDKVLGLVGDESVLDLACGIGTYSLELASRGRRVTALDISPTFLERLRTDAKRLGVNLRIVRGDCRKINFRDEFDALLLTAGLFYRNATELVAMLRRFRCALRPQGGLVMNQFNPAVLAKSPRRADWWRESPDVYVMESSEFNPETSSTAFFWQRVDLKSATAHKCKAVNKCLPLEEFSACIESAGFEVAHVYSNINLRAFDPEVDRSWFLVARRKD